MDIKEQFLTLKTFNEYQEKKHIFKKTIWILKTKKL